MSDLDARIAASGKEIDALYEAAIRHDERAKVLAEVRAAMCEECAQGQPAHRGVMGDQWYHGEGFACVRCAATPVRNLKAKAT